MGLIFAEFFLLILSHEVAGWLLGITFVRFGFWRGVLLLPLSLIPAAAAEFLLVAQWLADVLNGLGYHRPPLAVAVPSVLVVSALGLYAGYLVLRPMATETSERLKPMLCTGGVYKSADFCGWLRGHCGRRALVAK